MDWGKLRRSAGVLAGTGLLLGGIVILPVDGVAVVPVPGDLRDPQSLLGNRSPGSRQGGTLSDIKQDYAAPGGGYGGGAGWSNGVPAERGGGPVFAPAQSSGDLPASGSQGGDGSFGDAGGATAHRNAGYGGGGGFGGSGGGGGGGSGRKASGGGSGGSGSGGAGTGTGGSGTGSPDANGTGIGGSGPGLTGTSNGSGAGSIGKGGTFNRTGGSGGSGGSGGGLGLGLGSGHLPIVTPVPEPQTWAMMILGMAAVGAAMRRRNAMVVAAGVVG